MDNMNRPRLIPVLLIDQRRAVKTTRFQDPLYIGDPVNTTRIFSQKGVDELIVLDISTNTHKRPIDLVFISRLAEEAFMPFSYGGGIKTLDDARRLFDVGIEKVILGWGGEKTLTLLNEIAHIYGAQAVSVCVDLSEDSKTLRKCLKTGRHVEHRADAISLIQRIQEWGGGEVIVQNVDLDGTMAGMDHELMEQLHSSFKVPIVALGGARSLEDMAQALRSGANAVAAGSAFVFHNERRAVLINYPSDDEIMSVLNN
jgi:cyclase